MAIAVEKKGIKILGATAIVKKTMTNNPRRIAKIDIDLTFPRQYDKKTKTILERAAQNCPVHHSLSESIEKNNIQLFRLAYLLFCINHTMT